MADISAEDLARLQEKIDKLKNSKFKQQMLPAWRPVPSFGSTMIIFGVFGIIFLTLGVVLYVMSEDIQGAQKKYSDICTINTECTITVDIDSDITAPVYVYYQLDNFYQNHRRYVKSRSNTQLMGEYLAVDELDDCDPIKQNKDLKEGTKSVTGADLDPEAAAYPCGLVAKSFFDDKFTSFKRVEQGKADEDFEINDKGIAWESDVEYKFKNLQGDDYAKQWMNVEDGK